MCLNARAVTPPHPASGVLALLGCLTVQQRPIAKSSHGAIHGKATLSAYSAVPVKKLPSRFAAVKSRGGPCVRARALPWCNHQAELLLCLFSRKRKFIEFSFFSLPPRRGHLGATQNTAHSGRYWPIRKPRPGLGRGQAGASSLVASCPCPRTGQARGLRRSE